MTDSGMFEKLGGDLSKKLSQSPLLKKKKEEEQKRIQKEQAKIKEIYGKVNFDELVVENKNQKNRYILDTIDSIIEEEIDEFEMNKPKLSKNVS